MSWHKGGHSHPLAPNLSPAILTLSCKVTIYHATVLTTLLHACDTDFLQQTRQTAQPFSPELPPQTSTHQVAGQNPGHEGPALGWWLQCSHGP